MAYKSTTSVGTTTSSTDGFENTLTVTAEAKATAPVAMGSGVKVSASNKWGTTNTDETDISIDRSTGYSISTTIDGIDHNYDEIWFLIRPKLSATFTQPADPTKKPVLNWSFAENQDIRTNAIPAFVYAGWVNGQVPWNEAVQEQLAGLGITSDYYPELLAADPLAMGTISDPAQDTNRFDFITNMPFEPPLHAGDPLNPQAFIVNQKTTTSNTMTASHEVTVGLTVTGGTSFGGAISASLSVMREWKWTNKSSLKESSSDATMDTFTLSKPAFGYAGPNWVSVYEDRIYKTYAFGINGVCGPGVTAQFCNVAPPLCTWTRWGFERGESVWSNSADNNSSVSTAQAHSGTQSFAVSASDYPGIPSRIDNTPCFTTGDSTMDLRGKRFSAWVYVPTSTSSYAGTSCRLRAWNHAFQESAISSQAVRSPITPGSWFQLTGVFPSTSLEQQIYELTVECTLPTDWTFADPTKVWYADDITVQ